MVDLLSGRERVDSAPEQWVNLKNGIAQVLARRNRRDPSPGHFAYEPPRLDPHQAEIARDVFWDLFRQGYITLGINDSNPTWPWFRLSYFGERSLRAGDDPPRFHNPSSYLDVVRARLGQLDPITERYLTEAIGCFYSGCYLASCVMVGGAAEKEFLRLAERLACSSQAPTFAPVQNERTLLQKIRKFGNILDNMSRTLPSGVREDLDTHFSSIQALIRNFRNEAGHPSGAQIDREQTYVLLQLFIPFGRKLRELEAHFCL